MFKRTPLPNILMAAFLVPASIAVLFPTVQIPLVSMLVATLQFLDFGLHELGHLGLGILGQFISILGGTLGQLFLPTAVLISTLRRGQPVLVSFPIFWIGENLTNIATYMADAQAQALPLVSPLAFMGEPIHDWHYILSTLHLLWADKLLSAIVFGLGVLLLAYAIVRLFVPNLVGQALA
ncbi:MAG: hypothetical protein H6658_09995 [Ardenticatenaceae bacterium]|nr:hypothetical protein [Ardenticatenaceae bacterium]